jgi:hypothetical protein
MLILEILRVQNIAILTVTVSYTVCDTLVGAGELT